MDKRSTIFFYLAHRKPWSMHCLWRSFVVIWKYGSENLCSVEERFACCLTYQRTSWTWAHFFFKKPPVTMLGVCNTNCLFNRTPTDDKRYKATGKGGGGYHCSPTKMDWLGKCGTSRIVIWKQWVLIIYDNDNSWYLTVALLLVTLIMHGNVLFPVFSSSRSSNGSHEWQ